MTPPPLPGKNTKPLAVEAPTDLLPRCPHCEKDISQFLYRSIHDGIFTRFRKLVYFCPHCRAVLSVTETAI